MNQRLCTISPVDNSIYVERDYANYKAIEEALKKAEEVKQSWIKTSLKQRADYCKAAVENMVSNQEEIALELCWQMGRPIRYAPGEIKGFADRALYMIEAANAALAPIKLPEKTDFIRYIKREPLGLVLVIAPWNYPFLTAVNSIIPAIMAGNVVILKHSAQTPLVAERFAQAFAQAGLPEGVFQYLHLRHEDTEQLMQDHRINAISFTGSVAGGQLVEKAVSGRFIHVGLELGGKDPAYIRHDADIEMAVASAIDGAFFNSGQSCCGIERIYVHEAIYETFVAKAVNLVKQYQLGRPDDPETTIGPMVHSKAAEHVRKHIKEAIEQGARAHINPLDFPMDKPGSPYVAPQILTHVNHSMRIMNEETFGPVVGIMSVSGDDEAIHLMNDSEYGLTAAVYTQDWQQGIVIGEQLQCGTFFINRCDFLDPALAWTGVKKSGRGCSLSSVGYESLTRPKSYHVQINGTL